MYALKRIRLTGLDTESAQGFVDEIHLLRRLKGKPSIIQLVDAEVRRYFQLRCLQITITLLPFASSSLAALPFSRGVAW